MEFPLPKPRNLYIAKQIDQDSVNAVTRDIISITEDDKLLKKVYPAYGIEYTPLPIKIFIDSYGGHVYQTFGLINVMLNNSTPVHTIVTGCAMSGGFLIAICGSKRMCYKDSTLLYHQLSSGVSGTLKEMSDEVFEKTKLQGQIESIVLAKTKITKQKLKQVYFNKTDWYIDAKEGMRLGIIDEIIQTKKSL